MTDEQFLVALEQCRLPPAHFDHRQHVRAAFLYLDRLPFGAAIDAMSATLRRYVTAFGRADRYHETITVAFMALVHASRCAQGAQTWDEFAARNPALLRPDVLSRYYGRETLASAEARSFFVLERRAATDSAALSYRADRNPAGRADTRS